jgi:DNA-binding transcriptional MerR regulator
MRIGEVARHSGVSVQAVRLYERLGILPRARRLRSGYRDYSAEAPEMVSAIKRAQRLGFSLGEIKSMIDLRSAQRNRSEQARRLAQAKLDGLEAEIARLQTQRQTIQHCLDRCQCREMFPLCLIPGDEDLG